MLLLTAVTLLVLDLPGTGPLQPVRNVLAGIFRPVRSAGDAVFAPIGNGWKGAFGYDDVKDENDKLKAELEARKGEEAEIARLRRQNAELKRITGVDVEGLRTQGAQVIAESASSFDPTVDIDQGSGDGVKAGMAVITGVPGSGGGILGRILEVQGGRSKVELITNPSFQIGVRLESDARGVLQGQGRDQPLVGQVGDGPNGPVRIEVGDYVFTSGIDDSAFPGELAVGRVSKVEAGTNGQTIEVEPLADLTNTYVLVVLKDPPK